MAHRAQELRWQELEAAGHAASDVKTQMTDRARFIFPFSPSLGPGSPSALNDATHVQSEPSLLS